MDGADRETFMRADYAARRYFLEQAIKRYAVGFKIQLLESVVWETSCKLVVRNF